MKGLGALILGAPLLAACQAEDGIKPGGETSDETLPFVVTVSSLPWYQNGTTIARESRSSDSVCIESESFENSISPGDRISLTREAVDGCIEVEAVEDVQESSDVSNIACEVEGNVDQLEYVELVWGYKAEDLVGVGWLGEGDGDEGGFYTWWEMEAQLEDLVSPTIVSSYEDPDYGTMNTYRYEFEIPSNLVPFVFEDTDQFYPETYIAADYWFSHELSFYMGMENCSVED